MSREANKDNPLRGFMTGRYGSDELGMLLSFGALVLVIINLFLNSYVLTAAILVLVIAEGARYVSRNVEARRMENDLFFQRVPGLKPWLQNPSAAAQEFRSYKHLSCPNCHRRVRVPRGKGRLKVTCPQCHQSFDARS